MIYFHTAMYHEAKPVITRYGMTKLAEVSAFQVFRDRDKSVYLIVGGTGPVNGSVSTTFLLAKFPPGDGDVFVNLGACGADSKYSLGDCLLCNKIVDGTTGRANYPEMNYLHSFTEGVLYSSPRPVYSDRYENLPTADIYDMEAAFVFQAASKLMPLDRIFIIKIVSDHLGPNSVTSRGIAGIMEKNTVRVCEWLESVERTDGYERVQFSDEESELLERLAVNMKLTFFMRTNLFRRCMHMKLTGREITELLDKYSGYICSGKEDGKLVYERIISELTR